jgi:hypothetical protein
LEPVKGVLDRNAVAELSAEIVKRPQRLIVAGLVRA